MSDFYVFYGISTCPACATSYLISSSFRCLHLLTRGSPAASNFLLLRQKKVTKEKAPRLSGSPRFATGNLRCPAKTGVGANSLHCVALKQRAALIPFLRSTTGPDRTGKSGNEYRAAEQSNNPSPKTSAINTINSIAGYAYMTCANGTFDAQALVAAFVRASANPVLAGPLSARKNGIRAARCLSRRRVCADPRFYWRSKVAQSEAQGPSQPGRVSFAYFSLAKQRKVSRPPGETGPGIKNNQQNSRHSGGSRP